jgi:hypothetical protein
MAEAMPGKFTPPPHLDGPALIRRADALLRRWVELYGEHNTQWLPPAGIVNWQEDAGRYLAAHTLPSPSLATAALTESAKQHRVRGDTGHASICEAALREAAGPTVPNGAGVLSDDKRLEELIRKGRELTDGVEVGDRNALLPPEATRGVDSPDGAKR